MSEDPRLLDLLLRYEELQSQGEAPTPEELCRDCPDLLSEFRRRLDALARLAQDLAMEPGGPAGPSSQDGTIAEARLKHFRDVTEQETQESPPDAPVIPGYRITGEIARGGMGRVFAAWDIALGREVAIKTLLPGADANRFLSEAKITARLPHPAIPPVYALGTLEDGTPWLAMKLIHGQTLATLLLSRGREYLGDWRADTFHSPFKPDHSPAVHDEASGQREVPGADLPRLLQIFEQICQAVGFAHSRGIVHRDLKPMNVMVGEFGEVQVMDWGLAKDTGDDQKSPSGGRKSPVEERHPPVRDDAWKADALRSHERTAAGTILGTPGYMAPEQARGEAVDERADVFALGSVLAALLTGKPAFVGSSNWEIIHKSAKADLSDVMSRLDKCGADTELIRIAKRCLAAKPEERPKDGQVVAQEIAAYRAGVERRLREAEAERARAETQAAEQRKRHRLMLWAGGLSSAVLLLGIVGTSLGLLRANAAAEKERLANLTAMQEKAKAEEAARAESAAKEATQRRLAQIEKGVELLAGMLRGMNPRAEEQGGDPLYVQLRQRAEKAADQLVGESLADPVAVARLQTILGDALRELGNLAKAVEVLEKARATCERELGADHPDTLNTLNILAEAYQAAGRLNEAITLYERVRGARVRELGAEHPDTLTTLNSLAGAYRMAGRLKEAIALYEQVGPLREAKLGAEHADTLATWNNLGGAYRAAGRLGEAIALYERVRTAKLAKWGLEHPSTLTTLNNLALAYQTAGRLDEAIRLYEQVRAVKAAKLGADHPSTLTTLNNLAFAYQAGGRLDEAITLYEQVRNAQIKRLGADHPNTLTTLSNLALAHQTAGRVNEAVSLYNQILAVQEAKLGADHPDTLTTLNNLALAYQADGRNEEAITLLEQVRDAGVRKLGADHPHILSTMHNLAGIYQAAGRLHEAVALYEQVHMVRAMKLGADHPDTLTTLNNLAGAYQVVGQLEEAIALYEEVRMARTRKLGADHPDTLTTLNNLAGAYQAAGRVSEAIVWFKEAAAGIERHRFRHPQAALIVHNTINVSEQAKDYACAESWCRKWLDHIKGQVGSHHPSYVNELACLGVLLSKQSKWEQAEAVLRDARAIWEKQREGNLSEPPWQYFNTLSLLGGAILGKARNPDAGSEQANLLAEAEALLVTGYEGVKMHAESAETDAARSALQRLAAEALDRLIELYTLSGQADKVEKYRQLRSP